jgi:uncharacterized protein YaiL (DUF2058 family)
MQNLRDQLLKAGLITEEQKTKAEAQLERKGPKRREESKPKAEAAQQPQQKQDQAQQAPKISKKQLMKQPVNRMLDLSDPKTLKIYQAIEAHRSRAETKGDMPFHFTLRDGRVRKMFVNRVTSEALESGKLAIVEDGDPNRHVIVDAQAVPLIREVDTEAVRFAN